MNGLRLTQHTHSEQSHVLSPIIRWKLSQMTQNNANTWAAVGCGWIGLNEMENGKMVRGQWPHVLNRQHKSIAQMNFHINSLVDFIRADSRWQTLAGLSKMHTILYQALSPLPPKQQPADSSNFRWREAVTTILLT